MLAAAGVLSQQASDKSDLKLVDCVARLKQSSGGVVAGMTKQVRVTGCEQGSTFEDYDSQGSVEK
jgi:hypothetical protein